MVGEEGYEIMPHQTIENIKKDIDELKKRAISKESISSEGFRKSLDELTDSINSLMGLFKEAAEDIKVEEEAEDTIKAKLGPLIDKIDEIENENRTIAKSILTLTDLIKERLPKKSEETIRRVWKERIMPKPKIVMPAQPPATSKTNPSSGLSSNAPPFPSPPQFHSPPQHILPKQEQAPHAKLQSHFPQPLGSMSPSAPPVAPSSAPIHPPGSMPPLPNIGIEEPKKGLLTKLFKKK